MSLPCATSKQSKGACFLIRMIILRIKILEICLKFLKSVDSRGSHWKKKLNTLVLRKKTGYGKEKNRMIWKKGIQWVGCMYICRCVQRITHMNTSSTSYRVSLSWFVLEFDPLTELTVEQERIEKTIVPYDRFISSNSSVCNENTQYILY